MFKREKVPITVQ